MEGVDVLERVHPGVWAENRLGYTNAPFHWEWYTLMTEQRLCVVAPREHAKSEIFACVQAAHLATFRPGSWTYLFSATQVRAAELMERTRLVLAECARDLISRSRGGRFRIVLDNGSRIDAASVGQQVRGSHPDLIVADDILTDTNTSTSLQRRRLADWWFGTVAGMAHPATRRTMEIGRSVARISAAPTRIHLIGTPRHHSDLLMSMRGNPLYVFRRFAAEFDERDLVDGSWAVEAA